MRVLQEAVGDAFALCVAMEKLRWGEKGGIQAVWNPELALKDWIWNRGKWPAVVLGSFWKVTGLITPRQARVPRGCFCEEMKITFMPLYTIYICRQPPSFGNGHQKKDYLQMELFIFCILKYIYLCISWANSKTAKKTLIKRAKPLGQKFGFFLFY